MSAIIQTTKEESRQDCFNADVREHLYATGTWYFLLLTITRPYFSPASFEYTFLRTLSLTK